MTAGCAGVVERLNTVAPHACKRSYHGVIHDYQQGNLTTMRDVRDTAVLLAVMVKRSGQSRARVSDKTMKLISMRERLDAVFVTRLTHELEERGWTLSEIGAADFGLVRNQPLEVARAVTMKRWFTKDERLAMRKGNENWEELYEEEDAFPDEEPGDDGDEM